MYQPDILSFDESFFPPTKKVKYLPRLSYHRLNFIQKVMAKCHYIQDIKRKNNLNTPMKDFLRFCASSTCLSRKPSRVEKSSGALKEQGNMVKQRNVIEPVLYPTLMHKMSHRIKRDWRQSHSITCINHERKKYRDLFL